MIFKVSKKFKGSCVLPTLKKAIWADMTVSISGNDLRADDIKATVKKGILIPVDKKFDITEIYKDHDVIIVNNTGRVLVLGEITLRPNGSLPISRDVAHASSIVSAVENGLINILSNEEEEPVTKKKSTKKKTKKSTKKEAKEPEYVIPESGEDKEPVATTWDFREKKAVEAIKVPKSEGFIEVGDTEEIDDIEFVDGEKEDDAEFIDEKPVQKKTAKKKIAKKKTAKKKVSAKKKTKKKGKSTKSKKVKTLEPVGEKRLPKTAMDAAMELDSRGNPIGEKPGDTLQHLIDSLNPPEDVSFSDDEQALDRYNKRTDMG